MNSTDPSFDVKDKNATDYTEESEVVETVAATNDPPKPRKPKRPNPFQLKKVDRPGRNQPCPCGSGFKYKHCCLKKQTEQIAKQQELRRSWDEFQKKSEEAERSQEVVQDSTEESSEAEAGYNG